MRPVVDLLTMEIDLDHSDSVHRSGLPTSASQNGRYREEGSQCFKSDDRIVDMIESVDGDLNFGTFYLTQQFLGDPNSEVGDDDTKDPSSGQKKAAPEGNSSTKAAKKGPDQSGLDGRSTKGSKAGQKKSKKSGPAGSRSSSESRFRLPLLDDPASALGLLTGRPVDLFWYDLPDLDLQFEYSKSYPVFAGLNAVIGGSITAQTNFDFGFDTSGFIEWQESEYDASQAWRIMKGFYLDDHGAENTPGDEDEVTLTAEIFAGLSLGIGGLVEAGVIGGIEAIIGFDLNDKLTEFQDSDPIGDGRCTDMS